MNTPARDQRTSDFIDVPFRGAPLVVLLALMAAGSGLIAGSVGGANAWAFGLLVVFLATLCVSPVWMRLLAERSWPESPPPPRWFELAVRCAAVAFVGCVFLASASAWHGFTWSLFALQCLFTAVVAPLELRRYPGFFPRRTR